MSGVLRRFPDDGRIKRRELGRDAGAAPVVGLALGRHAGVDDLFA
jgi:hypothetical protein